MTFYQQIAPYYHHIFKINLAQISFVQDKIPNKLAKVLDIGCGIGTLSFEVANYYDKIIGVDLDAEMIKYATENFKNSLNSVAFYQVGMLDIAKKFDKNSFDGIICFGNTLVHLDSFTEVKEFLIQSKTVLKPSGKLLLQIVNYNQILAKKIKNLPLIENDEILFERKYNYLEVENRMEFKTVLTVKSSQEKLDNSVVLLPILQAELGQLLQETGIQNCNFYGNFNQEPYTIESPALIIEAW